MDYKFSNLLGVPYRGGNLLFFGDKLLGPAGNRVRELGLGDASSLTFPFESPHQVEVTVLSPDGSLLLTIDTSGRLLLALRHTRVLLHRMRLKSPAHAAKFSPDGTLIAIAVGKVLQIWNCPSREKTFAPMQLLRSFGGCQGDIVHIDWSLDSKWLAVACKDLTSRVFSASPIPGFKPPVLAGHREAVVAAFFASAQTQRAALLLGDPEPSVFTVSADGALFCYTFTPVEVIPDEARPAGSSKQPAKRKRSGWDSEDESESEAEALEDEEVAVAEDPKAHGFAYGSWKLTAKHYYRQQNTKLTAADYHGPTGLMVAAFSSGHFVMHQLPEFEHLQSLSISRHRISAIQFNKSGEWIALGCAALGQLLVWEWRSETYVLKQQGHFYDVSVVAFSPDGTHLASGADDSKLKVWSVASGSCFVTFAEHRGAVTGLVFTPNSNALVSCSLDGTARAFDLIRYRNFRTFVAPEPVQFSCVSVDSSGQVVCAGSKDTFQMFVWSMRTGQLLDIFSGHEGPVSGLAFNPSNTTVATCSWDKTVRLWNTYSGDKSPTEVLQHAHEVLCIAIHPTGRFLAAATLNGEVHFWDCQDAKLTGVIEARRDLRGGRLMTDRRTVDNTAAGRAFTALRYSADGALLFAGGMTKWVCVYDTRELVLLQRFQLSRNLALDGVLDQLSSRNMTDAGPLELLDVEEDDDAAVLPPAAPGGVEGASKLPGTTRGQKKAILQCKDLALSPSGGMWAAATTEGILVYSLASEALFDPTNLTEEISVPAMHRLIGHGAHLKALLVAVRLNERSLVRHVLLRVPPADMRGVIATMPAGVAAPVFAALAEDIGKSPHVEYVLAWARALCEVHGEALRSAPATETGPSFRAVQRGLQEVVRRLRPAVEACLHKLDYLSVVGQIPAKAADLDGMDTSS
eukprot:jgi/Ulvmu1/242/UM001_0246.1